MKTLTLLIFILSLSACAGQQRELPTNQGDESDTMKLSPCVCNPVDYDSRGFTWIS